MPAATRLAEAEALMAERRFAEAIAAFDLHLAAEPQDLRALLKLGICHLLNRSRGAFLEVHRRAEGLIACMGTLPADVAELYELYRGLLVRVGAASLVAGTLVLAPGCTEGPSVDEALSPVGKAAAAEAYRPQHRYSGGVQLKPKAKAFDAPAPKAPADAGLADEPEDAAAEAGFADEPEDAAADAGAVEHRPQHRYSGGVRLQRSSPGGTSRPWWSPGAQRGPNPKGDEASKPEPGDGDGRRLNEPADQK